MADRQKKMAAALAAVNAYLLMEEAAAGQGGAAVEPAPLAEQSNWSQSGRQDMMTMRRLMQLRTFAAVR